MLQRSVTLIRRLLCTLPNESMSELAGEVMAWSHDRGNRTMGTVRILSIGQVPCTWSGATEAGELGLFVGVRFLWKRL